MPSATRKQASSAKLTRNSSSYCQEATGIPSASYLSGTGISSYPAAGRAVCTHPISSSFLDCPIAEDASAECQPLPLETLGSLHGFAAIQEQAFPSHLEGSQQLPKGDVQPSAAVQPLSHPSGSGQPEAQQP
ncbi:hypothetical protein GH733_008120, partial [Mirounga leonina]